LQNRLILIQGKDARWKKSNGINIVDGFLVPQGRQTAAQGCSGWVRLMVFEKNVRPKV